MDCYFSIIEELGKLNWTAIGVVVSLIGIFLLWRQHSRDDQDKNSQFYLEQIKVYFATAISLLSGRDNNNIKWHQAIQLLKTVDSLKKSLRNPQHQHIFLIEYINAGFSIMDIIKSIDHFKFFYGIRDEYQNKDSASLYQVSNSSSKLGDHCLRISSESLSYLIRFLDKASRANYDLDEKTSAWQECFNSEYFQKSISEEREISEFTKLSTKIIHEYIEDYQVQQNRSS